MRAIKYGLTFLVFVGIVWFFFWGLGSYIHEVVEESKSELTVNMKKTDKYYLTSKGSLITGAKMTFEYLGEDGERKSIWVFEKDILYDLVGEEEYAVIKMDLISEEVELHLLKENFTKLKTAEDFEEHYNKHR
ncbi:hypothetical protein QTG56_26125 (plasmid) [Rossellomorea sp. AcN35-11]|nr:hypothetical protein [Rossellomorea aquimaris]WJV32095.1 hypothetical protein QTG56_26125 [Rossellomorea sp. AcN35-11]